MHIDGSYCKHTTILTNGKVPASLLIFKHSLPKQHICRVDKTDSQTLVVFEDVVRVHELSQFPGHQRAQSPKTAAFPPDVAGTQRDRIHSSKERPGPWLSSHESVGWGVPPRGCVIASSGRMRSFPARFQLLPPGQSSHPLILPTLPPTNSEDHSDQHISSRCHSCRKLSFLGRHY